MDHFELVSEYAPTGDQPKPLTSLSGDLKKATNFRRCLVLPVQVRHLPWQMSSHN